MKRDYYRVLGIDPNADLEAIKRAYRKMATECHPDHGGSHARMVLVNEAWRVLSDADVRRRYDQTRANACDQVAQQAAAADASQARQQAATYPRQWVDFEPLLDLLARDFARADYGSRSIGLLRFPTAGRSITGGLFIFGGAITGCLVVLPVILAALKAATGTPYLGTRPSAKRITRFKRDISELTTRRRVLVDVEIQVGQLNRMLCGWANYFSLGAVTAAYRGVDYHVRERLRRWLCRKHNVETRGLTQFPDQHLYQELRLVRLCDRTKRFPWAKGVTA